MTQLNGDRKENLSYIAKPSPKPSYRMDRIRKPLVCPSLTICHPANLHQAMPMPTGMQTRVIYTAVKICYHAKYVIEQYNSYNTIQQLHVLV